MDQHRYKTPLRERWLLPAEAGIAESRGQYAEEADSPIMAVHDTSQLAQMVHQMAAQLALLQEQQLAEQQSRQQECQLYEQALHDLHGQSQQLHAFVPQLRPDPDLPPALEMPAQTSTAAAVQASPLSAAAADPALPMSSGVKLDPPEPFTGISKQDVDDWLDRKDIYIITETRLPVAQKVLQAVLLLHDAASKWLMAILWLNNKTLQDLTWSLLREEIRGAFRVLDFEFTARDHLAKIKHTNEVHGYTAAFHETYYQCIGLSEQDAIWQYINGLKPLVGANIRIQFPAILAQAVSGASHYESSYHNVTQAIGERQPQGGSRGRQNGGKGNNPGRNPP